jgi:hypothetical protein
VSVLGWNYRGNAIVEVYQSGKVKVAQLLGHQQSLGPVRLHIDVRVWKHPKVGNAADDWIMLAAASATQSRAGTS